MKVLLFLVGLFVLATGEPIFDKCPDTLQNLPPIKSINVDHTLGIWYYIRKGPLGLYGPVVPNADCLSSVIWKEVGGSDNVVNHLFQIRKDGKYLSKSSQFTLVPAEEGLYENNFLDSNFRAESKISSIQEKLVETDEGKSWSLWVSCITKDTGNSSVVWSIKSRLPRMDPRVEQMVVEKVEKYGGVGPTQLRGVGQYHCHM